MSIREAKAVGEAYRWAAAANRSEYLWSFSFPTGTMPRTSKSSALVKIPSVWRSIRTQGELAFVNRSVAIRGGQYPPWMFKSVHLMILHMCIFQRHMDSQVIVRLFDRAFRWVARVSHRFGHPEGFRDSVSLPCFRTFRLPPVAPTFWCRHG